MTKGEGGVERLAVERGVGWVFSSSFRLSVHNHRGESAFWGDKKLHTIGVLQVQSFPNISCDHLDTFSCYVHWGLHSHCLEIWKLLLYLAKCMIPIQEFYMAIASLRLAKIMIPN